MMRFWRRQMRQFGRGLAAFWKTLTAPFRWVKWSLQASFRMLSSWYRSRLWRKLVWGLPAIVIFSLGGYFTTRHLLTRPSQLAALYTQAGRAAVRQSDWKSATLYLERAVELGVRNPTTMFDLALAAEQSGDESRKAAVLDRLAPTDRPVHAPAHLWKAVQLLAVSPVSREDQQAAENQLRLSLQLDADNVNAHALLGDLYFQRGYFEGAAHHLAKSSQTIARYQLLRARACVAVGRPEEARQSAMLAQSLSEAALAENPSDLAKRIELSQALHFLEDFESAVRVLQQGYDTTDDPSELKAAVAQVYLSWADQTLRSARPEREKRSLAFDLISRGMLANPDDRNVFDRMMEIVEVDDEISAEARELLLDNIATGRSVGMSHLLLGTSLQETKQADRAGFHLQQAFNLLPQAPIVANNLAWHLVHQEKPLVARAKSLIDAVIEANPGVPAYIDTRGHVYLAMKQWENAISDFQISLTQFATEPTVHEGLAEAYRNLDMTELADRHDAISLQLAEKMLTSNPGNAAKNSE
jgi:tetratricopeptide (TPR) repeat protein